MPSTSVVILNFNGKNYLEQFLPTVIEHSAEAEIVVVDNASTDDSVNFIKKTFPQLRLIEFSENHGFAGGYNQALAQIDSDYYLLLNSDVEVTSNWLSPMLDLMRQEDIAAVQPKIRSYQQKDHFEYAGAAGGYIDSLGYPFCRGRMFDHTEQDSGQYNDIRQVFWASGACLLIKANVFHEAGGFDESFFAHMEEIDLCWRINSRGQKVMICPQSTIYHVGAGTLSVTNPRKTYLNFHNNLAMITKNMTVGRLLWTLPIRWALDWIAAFKFLFGGMPRHSWSVLRAHFNYVIGFISIWRKRSSVVSNIPPGLTYGGSIVWNYFIRKKERFSDLKFD